MRISLALICISFSVSAEPIPEVHIGTQHWPPYVTKDGNLISGSAVEALDCVFKRMNQSYKLYVKPWQRVQLEVEKGKLDGFFPASQSEKRDKFATQSTPFINQEWYFYLHRHSTQLADHKIIKTKATLAARLNSNIYYWLKSDGYNLAAAPVDTPSLISLLQINRIDAVVENSDIFEYHLAQAQISLNELHQVHYKTHHLGAYFNQSYLEQYPRFLTRFNREAQYCSNIKAP